MYTYSVLATSKYSQIILIKMLKYHFFLGVSWSYGSWIYNYLCNQYLSPLMLWVWILLKWGVLDTALCDKVCKWLATGRWFSLCTPCFLHQKNWLPCNNWNIVESGVKHHNPNPFLVCQGNTIYLFSTTQEINHVHLTFSNFTASLW